ncbi:hypothetical protein TNCV_3562101 [Trichonephila clavipes]|nr:hypothetical protein TNCV_3562101 [Trichonephila clavipes]
MPEMYLSALKLILIRHRDVSTLVRNNGFSIRRGSEPLCRYRMQAGDERFSRKFETHYGYQNAALRTGTFEKTTLCHSCIELCRSVLQSPCLFLCCIGKGSQRDGHRAY